jgi:hypothetical protein
MPCEVNIDQQELDALKKELMDKAELGCQRGAVIVNSNHINPITPVRTGNLRDGNTFDVDRQEEQIDVTFHNEVFYDPFVNDGTARQRGQHYRDIGVHEGEQDFEQEVVNAVNE